MIRSLAGGYGWDGCCTFNARIVNFYIARKEDEVGMDVGCGCSGGGCCLGTSVAASRDVRTTTKKNTLQIQEGHARPAVGLSDVRRYRRHVDDGA